MTDIDMKSFKKVFDYTPLHPGSGPLLAFKLTLLALQQQNKEKTKTKSSTIQPLIIVSGPAAEVAKHIKDHKIFVSENPASAARASSLFHPTIVFADNSSAIRSLPSIVMSSNSNYLFISYNTTENSIAPIIRANYLATACTSYPEDYMAKIAKTQSVAGFKFIEIFCPDPKSGFDPSNAVEVGRLAVESSAWPLYEYADSQLALTKRPVRLEPLERYTTIQKKFSSIKPEQITEWQESINKRWKMLADGRLV